MAAKNPPQLLAIQPGALTGISKNDVETLQSIVRDIAGAFDRIAKAARMWANLPDETRSRVIEQTPESLRNMWYKLDRIGTKELHPQLFSAQGRAATLLGMMPIADQERYLAEKIPVAIAAGDDLRMDIDSMSDAIRKQVFSKKGTKVTIRTLAQQRAWLEEEKRKEEAKAKAASTTRIERPGRWVIEKGKAFIDPKKVDKGLTVADCAALMRDLRL